MSDKNKLSTHGKRFQEMVERRFGEEIGSPNFGDHEKALTQHLFIAVDHSLAAAEANRIKNGKDAAPFTWSNVNLPKLAFDAVHRVRLGLDALIPNHVWPIAKWNSKEKRYDIDLRIGYVGRDWVARRVAIDEVVDITYELVHEHDKFEALKRGLKRSVESYRFEIDDPWDRGGAVGGFGYIRYEDPTKNRLVLVTERDFNRARRASGNPRSDEASILWRDNDLEMMLKTVVHRTCSKVPVDPEKAASYAAVTREDLEYIDAEVETKRLEAAEGGLVDLPSAELPEPSDEKPGSAAFRQMVEQMKLDPAGAQYAVRVVTEAETDEELTEEHYAAAMALVDAGGPDALLDHLPDAGRRPGF